VRRQQLRVVMRAEARTDVAEHEVLDARPGGRRPDEHDQAPALRFEPSVLQGAPAHEVEPPAIPGATGGLDRYMLGLLPRCRVQFYEKPARAVAVRHEEAAGTRRVAVEESSSELRCDAALLRLGGWVHHGSFTTRGDHPRDQKAADQAGAGHDPAAVHRAEL